MKLLKNINYFILCFFVLVIEMTAGKYLSIFGTVPMLSFCLCLVIAQKEKNENYIITISIILGLILDLLLDHGLGFYAVTFTLSAMSTYYLRDITFSSRMLFLVFNTFILTILVCVLYYIFHILDIRASFWSIFVNIVIPVSIYNVFISILFYFILNKIFYKRR